jgi:hypothetical protein
MRPGGGLRAVAIAAVMLVAAPTAVVPSASALPPPVVDPTLVPADGPPGPEQPMRQSNLCAATMLTSAADAARPSPGFAMLNVSKAWQFSTGNGVTVALIDTGVTPGPRLPVIAGGDYVMGGDGLSDCDAHGTIVASSNATAAAAASALMRIAKAEEDRLAFETRMHEGKLKTEREDKLRSDQWLQRVWSSQPVQLVVLGLVLALLQYLGVSHMITELKGAP